MNTATLAGTQLDHVLLIRYNKIRQQSIALCQPLKAEDFVVQPVPFVSPPKWHLGHTTWFFENFILAPHLPDYSLYNAKFNYFFNSYYESQGPRVLRSNRGNMSRPAVDEIKQYRKYVDQHMEQLFKLDFDSNERINELNHLLEVGLQHEQQHQELLVTDIKYILGHNPLFPVYVDHIPSRYEIDQDGLDFLRFDEGLYQIGYTGNDFCWDNELSVHQGLFTRF